MGTSIEDVRSAMSQVAQNEAYTWKSLKTAASKLEDLVKVLGPFMENAEIVIKDKTDYESELIGRLGFLSDSLEDIVKSAPDTLKALRTARDEVRRAL